MENIKENIQKEYLFYVAEKNRRKDVDYQQFDVFLWENLLPDQKKTYKKYWLLYLRKKRELISQGHSTATITRLLNRKIKLCLLPLECKLFTRDYPKQYSNKDRKDFYGL